MRLCCLGVIAFLVCGSVASGDGCYIPERAVRKIPEIVGQRAVLSWKDGTETLIIESALDSQAQQLGWIIPVPNVPATIEKATPGTLKTLDFCIQPKVTHDLSALIQTAIFSMLVCNLLFGSLFLKRESLGCAAVFVLVLFLLIGLLLPAGNSGRDVTTRSSGVRVEKTAKVGSYAISVLRPERPDGLDSWLTENGFAALPEAARPIVADYVSRGWVFAAIKLTRSELGANVPHPIKLQFASDEPVYPMKLTALAGGSPAFELFVIGKDRAMCNELPEEFCDSYTQRADVDSETDERRTAYDGQTTHCDVGHAAICSLMWDGCVLTKLSGNLDAARMTDDIHFTWAPFKSHQDHYFTRNGAMNVASIVFILMVGIGNILSMWDYARGLAQPRGFGGYCVRRVLPLCAASGLIAGGIFAIAPKLTDADIQVSRLPASWAYVLGGICEGVLTEHPEVQAKSGPEIGDYLLANLRELHTPSNRLTGGELKIDDSPGNFTVEKAANRVLLRIYRADGSVMTRVLPEMRTSPSQDRTPSAKH